MVEVDIWAVLVAAVVSFFIGGFYFNSRNNFSNRRLLWVFSWLWLDLFRFCGEQPV